MSRYVIFLLALCRYVPPSCLMQPKPPVLYVVAWFALSIVPGQAEIIEVHTISQGSEIGAFFLFMLKPFTLTGSASSRLHASTSCSIHIFFVCLLEVVSASSVCFTLFIISFFIAQISWGCLLSDHVESRFFYARMARNFDGIPEATNSCVASDRCLFWYRSRSTLLSCRDSHI